VIFLFYVLTIQGKYGDFMGEVKKVTFRRKTTGRNK
jgi:hypothetical protein